MKWEGLLAACADRLEDLEHRELRGDLMRWYASPDGRCVDGVRLADALMESPDGRSWEETIQEHRAHRHPWYDVLAHELDAQGWSEFLWENTAFPGFIPLLERLREVQLLERGRAAIDRNLADEHVPAPHRELMQRLMLAVRAAAPREPGLRTLPSNLRRTLVFYYGFVCDPWHLVGSLFATESMAVHRIERMGVGLRRIGLDDHALEFIEVHSGCDEHHAQEWMDEVIRPTVRHRPRLSRSIATGIADCLTTSAQYLDDLCERFRGTAAAPGTGPPAA